MLGFPITLLGVGRTTAQVGSLFLWGINGNGQLGQGNTTIRSSPVQVGSGTTWVNGGISTQSDTAGSHVAFVKSDGTLWVCGNNGLGQLGLGDTTSRSSPTQVGALTDWASVFLGGQQTFAVKTDGTLWSWGKGEQGVLGSGSTANRSSPVQVGALTNWLKVAAGNYHTLAIKTDGTLWSWGHNQKGELGQGDTTNRSSPVQIGSSTDWASIAATGSSLNTVGESSAAIKSTGTLWVWGLNTNSILGLNDTTNRSSPTQVGALTTWSSISLGGDGDTASMAAIKTDGTLWTWGRNVAGQLGMGNTTALSSPVQVGALTTWQRVSVGSNTSGNYHMVATKTDGTLWSWGYNVDGQLGKGDTTTRSSPVQVGALTTWLLPFAGYRDSGGLQSP